MIWWPCNFGFAVDVLIWGSLVLQQVQAPSPRLLFSHLVLSYEAFQGFNTKPLCLKPIVWEQTSVLFDVVGDLLHQEKLGQAIVTAVVQSTCRLDLQAFTLEGGAASLFASRLVHPDIIN